MSRKRPDADPLRAASQIAPVARPDSLTMLAYRHIREAILNGAFMPGESLNVVELAATLGMSRSPVRVALERLAAERLLEASDSSLVLRRISAEEFTQSLVVREALEVMAARFAAPVIDDEAIAQLGLVHGRFGGAIREGDVHGAAQIDLKFHAVISAHCGNGVLSNHLEQLRSVAILTAYDFGYTQGDAGPVAEHDAILSALRSHDGQAAAHAMTAHMRSIEERARRRTATAG